MKKTILLCLAFLSGISLPGFTQSGYSDHKTLSGRTNALARANPRVCTVASLAKTAGGREILVLTAGTGEVDNKPAIAILGGIEGNHLLGREIAIGLAETLLKEHQDLLQKVTFYIVPDVNPDASEQFFMPVRYERTINARSTDDDRDFIEGEDPFEDLDKDGMITHIRIQDPEGRFAPDPDDQRLMKEAEVSKGQTGGFIYITEGIDNDDDGKFNEDGEGGVNFNRNFTFDYEEFGTNAGLHAISEPEVKAIADFLYSKFNVFAVFSFGPQDNLGQPLKNGPPGQERRITSIMPSDESINKLLSDKYHEFTGLKGAPAPVKCPGNFMDWAYFHYGRYSFSSPGWWFPVEKGKNPEAEFLKYAEKNNIQDVFLPWKATEHPGFPGKKAETGGLKPYVLTNPPADSVQTLVRKNIDFLLAAAAMHPELEFTGIKTESLGNDIFRVELKIHNKGIFATMPQVAENNTWTRIMRLSVEPSGNQEIVSGRKVQRISRLEGGQSVTFTWLINGRGTIKISAGAVNTGIITTTADLR